MQIPDWTVDYGDGEIAVILPHCWRQDVPVDWEGPAIYRRLMSVPDEPCKLRFHGVSYAAEVFINGQSVLTHEGIWDAFDVDLSDWLNQDISIEVRVTKNGGATYPVTRVLSGFLPYVFHTFGGIYKRVELVRHGAPLTFNKARQRFATNGPQLTVDDKPFYPRGVLTWGWYPEMGCPNPPEETIRNEVRALKAIGFNLVKFCLWLPPHEYLDLLNEHHMFAWIELPLWKPESDSEVQANMASEILRIVEQYRHHDNIAFWTAGCELGASTTAGFREDIVLRIKELTGSPLVKDDSGGAEMYGGDLREFGDFDDYHPYCDLPFYPVVLDSLMPGPRKPRPLLLGEFNDIDVLRDLARLKIERPYWASPDSPLNAQGVRWAHDLPGCAESHRFATDPEGNRLPRAITDSVHKASFVRKVVQEWVRSRDAISGYVMTGIRDTPISTAGFFNDWGELRYAKDDVLHWNGPSNLFMIPYRRPPWVAGGNRPGWLGFFNQFEGQVAVKIGVHSERQLDGLLVWDIVSVTWSGNERPRGRVAHGECDPCKVAPLSSSEIGTVIWDNATPGGYVLRATYCGVVNSWPFWVVPRLAPDDFSNCSLLDPGGLLEGIAGGEGPNLLATSVPGDLWDRVRGGGRVLLLMGEEGTTPGPFWRESAYEFRNERFWNSLEMAHRWERFLPITPDRFINDKWHDRLQKEASEVETLMNRIDARTMCESPVLVRARIGKGVLIATTLRPFGGLGISPCPLEFNPSGVWLLRKLVQALAD